MIESESHAVVAKKRGTAENQGRKGGWSSSLQRITNKQQFVSSSVERAENIVTVFVSLEF
jgi:hypothetical protein